MQERPEEERPSAPQLQVVRRKKLQPSCLGRLSAPARHAQEHPSSVMPRSAEPFSLVPFVAFTGICLEHSSREGERRKKRNDLDAAMCWKAFFSR